MFGIESTDEQQRLKNLLRQLGLAENLLSTASWTVLASAAAVDEEMSSVYSQLNRELQALVTLHPMVITHITGEARVLVDPAHRNVIRSNYIRGGSTTLACKDRLDPIQDASSFLAAQRDHWTLLTWVDFIDILALFATGGAILRVLNREANVHYSIFGRDRILMQEPQHDASERKRLWYLQSDSLVRLLALTTEDLLAESRIIPSTGFDAMLQWLYTEEIFPLIGAKEVPEPMWSRLAETDIYRLRQIGVLTRDDRHPRRIRLLPNLTYLEVGEHGERE